MAAPVIRVDLSQPGAVIRPELHGQFAEHLGVCIDGGLWVGEQSDIPHVRGFHQGVLEALKKLNIPLLRWPGGCFADDYHWRDGIGPRQDRPRTVNLWWGHSVENNHFGTHEFIQLCRLLGAQPYLAGNLGSGSVREMREWVEYCNFPGDSTLARMRAANGSPFPFNVRYWGVGNENWGCGGNFCPEDYGAEFKRYATYLRDFGEAKLFLIACGPDTGGREDMHADWTRRFLKKIASFPHIHAFAAHYYCGTAGTATEYDTNQWYELLAKAMRMESMILTQRALMDEFESARRIALVVDEWGTWHPPAPGRNPQHLWQQNTLRDALVAALTLDIFHRHSDKVVLANIAQIANVLQSMVLTDKERVVTTPTYHVFDLYQTHQNGQSLPVLFEAPDIRFAAGDQERRLPALSGSASLRGGELTLSVVNAHASLPMDANIILHGGAAREVDVSTLAHEELTAHNTFDEPDTVKPSRETIELDGEWRHTFPPASVTVFRSRL